MGRFSGAVILSAVVLQAAWAEMPSDAAVLQAQITTAWRAGEKKVRIAPGTYRLAAPKGAGSCLTFSNVKDLEIDATDALLLCVDRVSTAITFHNCEGVTWRGGTIRHDPVPFSQGTVEKIGEDGKSVEIRVTKGYPADLDNARYFPPERAKFLNVYDAATRLRKGGVSDLYFSDAQKVEPGLFRFLLRARAPSELKPGDPVSWRGGGRADITLYRSAKMKLLDVRIESGIGFCVHESRGEGGNQYRYTVTRGPVPAGAEEPPLLACNADAFHSSDVRKGPLLEDCLFEYMDDDGVPIHGSYGIVAGRDDAGVVLAALGREFCRAGDRLRFYRTDGSLVGEVRAGAVTAEDVFGPSVGYEGRLRPFKEQPQRVAFARVAGKLPFAVEDGWLVANVDAIGSGFVVRRCTIRQSRARGMLIKASDGLIEDCVIEGTTMAGIALWPDMSYWNESDYAQDIVIRRNVLRRVGTWGDSWNEMAGALSIGADLDKKYVASPKGHARIVVEGNRFENNDGVNVLITSAEDVILKGNIFVEPMAHVTKRGSRTLDPDSLIWVTDSRKVVLEGNVFSKAGPALKTPINASPSVVESRLQGGLTKNSQAP